MKFERVDVKSIKADLAKGEVTLALSMSLDLHVMLHRHKLGEWQDNDVALTIELAQIGGSQPGLFEEEATTASIVAKGERLLQMERELLGAEPGDDTAHVAAIGPSLGEATLTHRGRTVNFDDAEAAAGLMGDFVAHTLGAGESDE